MLTDPSPCPTCGAPANDRDPYCRDTDGCDAPVDVAASLRAAGLRGVPCGLNADWCVRAWDCGSDLYLAEEDARRDRFYALRRAHDASGNITDTHLTGTWTLAAAVDAIRAALETNPTSKATRPRGATEQAMPTPLEGFTLPPEHPVWTEWDACADYFAARGASPELVDDTLRLIAADPKAFQARIRAFAYARAMAWIHTDD
jgi:hypothetical protein